MVVILSREANASPHVLREVERAVSDGDFIVPFRIEDVQPSEEMELLISSSHWLDALTPPVEKHIRSLALSIESLLETQPAKQASRTARRAVVEAAGHMPEDAVGEEPIRRRLIRWWVGAGVLAVAGAAAVAVLVGGNVAPQAETPGHLETFVGPVLTYDWSFESRGLSDLVFQIRREDPVGASVINRAVESSYREDRHIVGPITWQVRAIWKVGDSERRSAWSEPRTVTWYPDTLTKIQETGVLNVAITDDAIRFLDGQIESTGFEIEFLRGALSQHLKEQGLKTLQIRHELFPWNEDFFHILNNSDYDVMVGGITIKEERTEQWMIEFTEPVYSYPQSLVHLSDRSPCFLPEATAGQCRIGVKAGTTNEELAKKIAEVYGDVEVRPFPDEKVYDVLADALVGGRLELALMDQPFALDLLTSQAGDLLRVTNVGESIIPNPPLEKIGIGTKKFDTELRDVLNKAIPTVGPEIEKLIPSPAVSDAGVK